MCGVLFVLAVKKKGKRQIKSNVDVLLQHLRQGLGGTSHGTPCSGTYMLHRLVSTLPQYSLHVQM